MICILKMNGAEIVGWVIANDIPEARRQAYDPELANILYRMEFAPKPGKYPLRGGYVMLVS